MSRRKGAHESQGGLVERIRRAAIHSEGDSPQALFSRVHVESVVIGGTVECSGDSLCRACPQRRTGDGHGEKSGRGSLRGEQATIPPHRPAQKGRMLRAGSLLHKRQKLVEQHCQRVGPIGPGMPVGIGTAVDRRHGQGRAKRCHDIGKTNSVKGEPVVAAEPVQAIHGGARRHGRRRNGPSHRALHVDASKVPMGDADAWWRRISGSAAGTVQERHARAGQHNGTTAGPDSDNDLSASRSRHDETVHRPPT